MELDDPKIRKLDSLIIQGQEVAKTNKIDPELGIEVIDPISFTSWTSEVGQFFVDYIYEKNVFVAQFNVKVRYSKLIYQDLDTVLLGVRLLQNLKKYLVENQHPLMIENTDAKTKNFYNALKLLQQQRKKAIELLKERYCGSYSRFSDENELSSKFESTSSDLPGMSWPIEDSEVKLWYFETISVLEQTLGKSNDCLKGMKKLRKELLCDDIHFGDGEFNTFMTGNLLDHSIEFLEDCITQLETRIRISTKVNPRYNPPKTQNQLQVRNISKRVQRVKCPKPVREKLRRIHFGSSLDGKCYVCGTEIKFTDFEASHNVPYVEGGEWHVDNLRPCCRACNRSMGTMTVDEFKKRFFESRAGSDKNNIK